MPYSQTGAGTVISRRYVSTFCLKSQENGESDEKEERVEGERGEGGRGKRYKDAEEDVRGRKGSKRKGGERRELMEGG